MPHMADFELRLPPLPQEASGGQYIIDDQPAPELEAGPGRPRAAAAASTGQQHRGEGCVRAV